MAKYVRIYMSESDYELIERIAKNSGKGISTLAREIITNGLKQELKDTALLNKLIQKIESLSESQPQNQPLQLQQTEQFHELRNLIFMVYLVARNTLLNSSIPEATKHSLMNFFDRHEREVFGGTLYEIFGLKKSE
ncbi:hypothetical protein QI155_03260 [Thermodesulfovibrio sp. 1176]|uniref:hypothetical protein n=1 Tax=Thermodesulfovibrio sp. 1176 TaxID=3043424 RepID=UPI0024824A33|nr:hypothetical protein [Thermodesulfovibrio sp. 1176]MDI1471542.1 hypothetical protein [Thermodesulfovibrio sp. 1176]